MRGGNDPMARDDQRDRVMAVGLANRPGASARLGRNVLVAAGLAIGDLTERFPYGQTIGCAGGCQRKIELPEFTVEIGLQLLFRLIQQRRTALVAAPTPVKRDD